MDMAESAVQKVKPAVLVIDSIAMLAPKDMLKVRMSDKDFQGLAARKITEGMKKLTLANSSTALIIIPNKPILYVG